MVSNLVNEKVINKVAIYSDYNVKLQEVIKGEINRVVIRSNWHIITKTIIDSVWEVVDEYSKKYDNNCIYATIQSAPYLTKSGDFLHEPTIEITIRVAQK